MYGRDAVVCARVSITEDEGRNGRGGDGSEYRSAFEVALRRAGGFLVILAVSRMWLKLFVRWRKQGRW